MSDTDDFIEQALSDVVANVTGELAPGGHYACPVDGCTQAWVIPEVITQAVNSVGDPMEFTAPGPMRVQYVGVTRERVEQVIGGHLESHPPEDWVLTVAELRTRIRELAAALDEHACPSPASVVAASPLFTVTPPSPPAVHLIPVPVWGPMVQRWRR